MTEIYNSNKEKYLDLVKNVWDLDDESVEYIKKRLSDEWEPVPEFKNLLNSENGKYEDQRIIFDMDMSNPDIQYFFAENDPAYKVFKEAFRYILCFLEEKYNCKINYKEFIENKVVFKKNITKIKKVFEVAYAEMPELFEREFPLSYTKEACSEAIVKKFEKIGSSKKSAKKLQFVISFNPMDWLLSSTAENWSSCFNINSPSGGYQYCLGLPFLCGDRNRMLLYITDGTEKECMGIKAHHFYTRTWCILNTTGTFNIVKWYPNNTIGVKPVKAITKNNNFEDNYSFKRGKYPIDVISTKKGIVIGVYSDMGKLVEEDGKLWLDGNGKDGQQLFTKNLIDIQKINDSSSTRHSFHLSDSIVDASSRTLGIDLHKYNIPKWKKVGMHVDMLIPSLRCSCGSEKGGFTFRGEKYFCQDCYKKYVFVCDDCGSEDYKDEANCHTIEATTGKTVHLCQKCWDNRESRICSCCGKYILHGDANKTDEGTVICSECLKKSNDWKECKSCKTITRNIRYLYNTFTKEVNSCCNSCLSKHSDDFLEISTFGRFFGIRKISNPKNLQNVE